MGNDNDIHHFGKFLLIFELGRGQYSAPNQDKESPWAKHRRQVLSGHVHKNEKYSQFYNIHNVTLNFCLSGSIIIISRGLLQMQIYI